MPGILRTRCGLRPWLARHPGRDLDGGQWIINGQKIWTSKAREANRIFVLARTDRDAPKHRGITFLLVDLDQPGIEVRPIKALSGESEFNEVFFTAATTPSDRIVGPVNGGWAVAMSLLGLERGDEAATNPILFRAEFERLIAMARDRKRTGDPLIRDRLAAAYARCEIMRFLGMRILTGVLKEGSLGPEASISKLYWSDVPPVRHGVGPRRPRRRCPHGIGPGPAAVMAHR